MLLEELEMCDRGMQIAERHERLDVVSHETD